MRKLIRPCKNCGKPFHGRKERQYCSAACRQEAPRVPWNKGKNVPGPQPRNGDLLTCATCGQQLYASAMRLGRAKYCSYACYYLGRWGRSRTVAKNCTICGTPFQSHESDNRLTCSMECRNKQVGRSHQAERSHLWRGGKMAPYVGIWKERRRQCYERDSFKCALCDSTDRIQCHHIVPYRYSHSHDLSNLVTLCRSCHSRQELKVNDVVAQTLLRGRIARHSGNAPQDGLHLPSDPIVS